MNKIKDYYNKSMEKHHEFRESYAIGQLNSIMVISVIVFIHGLLGMFVYGDYMVKTEQYVKNIFMTLTALAVISFTLSAVSRYRYNCKDLDVKGPYLEILSIMYAIAYLIWGFMPVYYSIKEGSPTSYLSILIVYTVCSCFMYYSPQNYILLYAICSIVSSYILNTLKPDIFEVSVYVDVLILGGILTAAGISKYYARKREYEALISEKTMNEEMEESNRELVSSNKELKELTEKLKESENTQKKFTASMNHELRSPLNGTIGLLQMLKDDDSLNEEQKDYVSRALQSSETLIQIVNDILDFAKMEAGEYQVADERFDLRRVIESIEDITVAQAQSKSLKYKINVPADTPCTLKGDGPHIQQIIINLATNGIKYTEEGSVRLSVSVKEDSLLCISVADTGCGISKESIPYLFKPYKRFVDGQKNYIQGTGLGLSIVSELVKKLKGKIDVESEVGKGSLFKVEIPVEVLDPVEYYGQARLKDQEKEVIPDFTGLRILGVDDTPVNLTVFKGLMSKTGAYIETASGGIEALEMLKKHQYDIVFLDHMMPDIDGIEVFRELRSREGINREVPVIALTANAGAQAEVNYREIGFNGYLAKPILKENLYSVVNSYFINNN